MAVNFNLSDQLKQYIRSVFDEFSYSEIETKRGQLFQAICDEIAARNKGVVDLGKAISIYFHLDEAFAEELAWIRDLQGDKVFSRALQRNQQRGLYRAVDSSLTAIQDTLVQDSIVAKIESDSPIFRFVFRKSGNGYKDVKFPVFATDVAPTKKSINATFDDFTATGGAITGLTSVTVEPHKIGFTMDFEAEAFVKLNPRFVSELIDIMTRLYIRGVKKDLYLGNGTAPASVGMFTNATDFGTVTNIETELPKMIARVGNDSKAERGYFIVTNVSGAAHLAGKKLTNDALNINIGLQGPGVAGTVLNIPLVVDNVLDNVQGTETNNNKYYAPIYFGIVDHYLWVEGSAPRVETNVFGNFKTGLQTVRIMGINGGKPAFNNSFGKALVEVYSV